MILRNVERQPFRSLFSAVGVAFSVAILVVGMFMFDGVDYMMDLQFRVAQREDLSLTFNRAVLGIGHATTSPTCPASRGSSRSAWCRSAFVPGIASARSPSPASSPSLVCDVS